MKKLTTEKFVEKAKIIHKNKYDYSNVNYVNNNTNVDIVCPIHGNFSQSPNSHLIGKGCFICGIDIRINTRKNNCGVKFFIKSKFLHKNKYDYSKFIYLDASSNGIIICPIHGEFNQTPDNHLHGQGCPSCKNIIIGIKNRLDDGEFIIKSNKKHDCKYDYSKFIYTNNRIKSIIICPKHGEFSQTFDSHVRGSGCPKCYSSKGELKIIKFLENNNIKYISQKKFDDCKNPKTNYKLSFDFYIPSKNLLIEYDGEQHFHIISSRYYKITEKKLKYIKYKDKIKTKYSRNNNIKLLRIKYTNFNKIDEILSKEFDA